MTRRAGIIGYPVAHSLSPVFQRAAFEHAGLDVSYEAWETPPAELEIRVHSLREPDMLGANVTIPHKQAVIPFLDELGGLSARIGAVNTIVQRDGRLFGFNTDGPGFVEAMRREAHVDPVGKSVLVYGAGGAARGIVFALLEAGASAIAIVNRTFARAEALARDAGGRVTALFTPPSLGDYGVVVNTTSLGMSGSGAESLSPCDFQGAAPGALAVDIVYVPRSTPFLRAAQAHGLRALGGLPMLIYQGALAFTHWTGTPAPVEVMFEAAHRELAARSHGA